MIPALNQQNSAKTSEDPEREVQIDRQLSEQRSSLDTIQLGSNALDSLNEIYRHTKVCVTAKYETFTGDYAFGWSLQIPVVRRDKVIRTNFASQGHFYFNWTAF